MEFIIGRKYTVENSPCNPYTAIAKSSKYLVFEDCEGDIMVRTDNQFQTDFTPVMQHPPCSLEQAEIGDTLERWNGEMLLVERIDGDLVQPICADGHWYSRDGFFTQNRMDSQYNAKALHKAHKGIEPLESGEYITGSLVAKINELVSAVNSLTDRVKKLEGKQ